MWQAQKITLWQLDQEGYIDEFSNVMTQCLGWVVKCWCFQFVWWVYSIYMWQWWVVGIEYCLSVFWLPANDSVILLPYSAAGSSAFTCFSTTDCRGDAVSRVTRPGDCCAGAGLSFMVPNESCTNCFRKPVYAQLVLALYVQYVYEIACRISGNSYMKLVPEGHSLTLQEVVIIWLKVFGQNLKATESHSRY